MSIIIHQMLTCSNSGRDDAFVIWVGSGNLKIAARARSLSIEHRRRFAAAIHLYCVLNLRNNSGTSLYIAAHIVATKDRKRDV